MSDIAKFAEERLGIELAPFQIRAAEAAMRGEYVVYPMQSGRKEMLYVLSRYWEASRQ